MNGEETTTEWFAFRLTKAERHILDFFAKEMGKTRGGLLRYDIVSMLYHDEQHTRRFFEEHKADYGLVTCGVELTLDGLGKEVNENA